MQLKIGDNTFDLISFTEQTNTFRIGYIFSMPIAETQIDIIKSASEFDLINGETTTHFDGVEFDKYSVDADNVITYTLYKEIGQRVDELNGKVSALEVSQQEQDDIIIELLSLS